MNTKRNNYVSVHKRLQRHWQRGSKTYEFNSINEAASKIGIVSTGITNNLRGRAKSAGGLIWSYV